MIMLEVHVSNSFSFGMCAQRGIFLHENLWRSLTF